MREFLEKKDAENYLAPLLQGDQFFHFFVQNPF
jgi:hypothetical protein